MKKKKSFESKKNEFSEDEKVLAGGLIFAILLFGAIILFGGFKFEPPKLINNCTEIIELPNSPQETAQIRGSSKKVSAVFNYNGEEYYLTYFRVYKKIYSNTPIYECIPTGLGSYECYPTNTTLLGLDAVESIKIYQAYQQQTKYCFYFNPDFFVIADKMGVLK